MIKVYTKRELCEGELILENDKHFFRNVNREYIDDYCEKLIWEIDKAKIIDERRLTVKTPFGVTEITNLSTGVKIIINAYNLVKKGDTAAISMIELGDNAISYLYDVLDGSNAAIYVNSYKVSRFTEGEYEFIVNDEYKVTGSKELSYLIREMGDRKDDRENQL